MIEQQLAERLRAIVVDEPPLRLDLDALVDRLLRQRSALRRVSSRWWRPRWRE